MVFNVILDEVSKRDRCGLVENTSGFEAIFGDAVNNCFQNFMLGLPPFQERGPWLIGIAVGGDPVVLRVVRSKVRPSCGGPNEALAVIGSRVEQVADDLLPGPASLTPRNICQ